MIIGAYFDSRVAVWSGSAYIFAQLDAVNWSFQEPQKSYKTVYWGIYDHNRSGSCYSYYHCSSRHYDTY